MRNRRYVHTLVMVLVLAVALAGLRNGRVQAEEGEGWNFTLTPFLWATGLDGTVSVGQFDETLDVSFGDLVDSMTLGAMADFRIDHNRWGIQTNLVWADLESDGSKGSIDVDVRPSMLIADLDGHFQVTDMFEVLVGVRYFDINVDLDVKAEGDRASLSTSGDRNWLDPMVGLGLTAPLSERWTFDLHGDIGGFGVGSDFAWQLRGGFDWRIWKSNSLTFGWRHLAWDYKDSSGASPFELDSYMTGPFVGVRFRF